jgi:hypothetical protein
LKNKEESETHAYYWNPNLSYLGSSGIGPFFVTRWVIIALARCLRRKEITDATSFKSILDKSINWLCSKQLPDGSWKERPNDIVGPGFCVYANMALWEYLLTSYPTKRKEITQKLQNLCLSFRDKPRVCFRKKSLCTENINRKLNNIFVLLPFKEIFKGVYKTVEKVFAKRGYKVEKADSEFRNVEIMCQNICKKIQEARLIIADISEDNPNVFYEIGLAHGMERDVWLISKKKKKYPFDIEGIRFIEYENPTDLDHQLRTKVFPYLNRELNL